MAKSIEPLTAYPADPLIAALPKADLHVHQEWMPRLDRVLARRDGRAPYDWPGWVRRMMAETPPGMTRLGQLAGTLRLPPEADADPEDFIARVEDLLDEAADGAWLVEVRFGNETVLRPDFMDLFREAERRVRARYPRLHAEAIATLLLWLAPERLAVMLDTCVRAARDGLWGIDLLYRPYDTEADWADAYRLAARAADAGLGITAHAGEFSAANIAAALAVPGLTRIGHGVYAAYDERLLALLAERGVTVECSLSCNVILGAVPSYEEHPIRRFMEYGIPVALCTDDPIQICTTIGREYALAHALGFSPAELLGFTRAAVRAAFMAPERRARLLADLRAWEDSTSI